MAHETRETSAPSTLSHIFSIIIALGCIGLSIAIVALFYIPNRPSNINTKIVQERKETLKSLVNMQKMVVNSYMWFEKDKGIVLIPVDRAMELVVEEYNNPKILQPKVVSAIQPAATEKVFTTEVKPSEVPVVHLNSPFTPSASLEPVSSSPKSTPIAPATNASNH